MALPEQQQRTALNANADKGWDDYAERVLRNEGRLEGLEQLVRETREADTKLIEMRSDALEKILEARSAALADLAAENRKADQNEYRQALENHEAINVQERENQKREGEQLLSLLREMYDTAIRMNYEQSKAEIADLNGRISLRFDAVVELVHSLEQRREAATANLALQVNAWRESDREARVLQAQEYERRLAELNGEHRRTAEVLAKSVTQEVFTAEIRAIHNLIGVIDRQILTMPTNTEADKSHDALSDRIDKMSETLGATSSARMDVINEKIADLREQSVGLSSTSAKVGSLEAQVNALHKRLDVRDGKGQGMTALYGWAVAAIGLIITIILFANSFYGGQ